MQLDPEIDVPADGLADRREASDEVVDPCRLAHPVVLMLEEQDLQRGVAVILDRAPRGLDDLLERPGVDDPHRAHRTARAAAEQLPHGHLEALALEIPERLVDRAEGARDRHAAETERPVQRRANGARRREGPGPAGRSRRS